MKWYNDVNDEAKPYTIYVGFHSGVIECCTREYNIRSIMRFRVTVNRKWISLRGGNSEDRSISGLKKRISNMLDMLDKRYNRGDYCKKRQGSNYGCKSGFPIASGAIVFSLRKSAKSGLWSQSGICINPIAQ